MPNPEELCAELGYDYLLAWTFMEKVDEVYGSAILVWQVDDKRPGTAFLLAIVKPIESLSAVLSNTWGGGTITAVEVQSLLEVFE